MRGGGKAAAAHQVGYVLRVEQRVQELSCQVNGRLCDGNSSWFRDRERGRLLFVLVVFNQGRLWTQKTTVGDTGLANNEPAAAVSNTFLLPTL